MHHFGVRDQFQDRMITMLTKKYSLDIIKFDSWLEINHGYDIKKHGSMSDFVKMKFGQDAVDFIEKLLG